MLKLYPVRRVSNKFIIVLILLHSYFLFAQQILAQDVNTQICDDNSPANKPTLISAIPGKDNVTLTWTEALDPVTHYLVAYGRSETEIEFGNPNIGGRGTTTYTVGSLTPGVKYYFKIRPVNGCRPGDFSNKLPATPGIIKSKGLVNRPNLSIYKETTPAPTTSAIEIETREIDITHIATNDETSRCLKCVGWQFLLVETIFLILYFNITKKLTYLKPIYSIVIPILISVLFWKVNQECVSKVLTCKYFVPLNIMIFMVIVVTHKNKYLNFNAKTFGKLFEDKAGRDAKKNKK